MNPVLLETYQNHDWPGNIRELKHTIEKAVILSDGRHVQESHINTQMELENNDPFPEDLSLASLEKEAISRALCLTDNNLSKAAKILEISRTTLYSKIQKHGL